MKKAKLGTKLTLTRETLGRLDAPELRQAQAGDGSAQPGLTVVKTCFTWQESVCLC
jgi:hypothetical protein